MKTSGGGVTNFNVSRKNFNVGTHFDHFGRDFRVNDIGFFRTRANRNQAEGYAEVGQPDPWKIFRRFWGFSSYGYGWTDERLIINDYFETGVSFQFLNYWNFNFGGGRQGDVYDDLDTRGGPPIVKPARSSCSTTRTATRGSDGSSIWAATSGGTPSAAPAATRGPVCHFNRTTACWRRSRPTTAPVSTSRSGSPIRIRTATASSTTSTARSIATSST